MRLPFVDVQRGPNGTRHYYFRRNKQRWPLRGEPLSEAFLEEYRRLLAETESGKGAAPPKDRRAFGSGSFGALVSDYLASGDFRQKKASTQDTYRRVLEQLQPGMGTSRQARCGAGTSGRCEMSSPTHRARRTQSFAC